MDNYLLEMLDKKEREILELKDRIQCHIVQDRLDEWLRKLAFWREDC